MPRRKQLTWTELRVGLFVLVGVFIVAVGIIYVTGTNLFTPKYYLKTYLPEVEGLTIGAPVRLDGVEIGNVKSIKLAEPPDRDRNIELTLRLNQRYQDQILADSTAGLITEGLLGTRYVNIHRGLKGLPLREWQEIPGQEEKAVKQIVERGAELAENLTVMSQEVSEIVDGIKRGRGTLGKLLTDETAYDRLASTLGRLDELVASVQAGEGSLGKLVATDELYQNADAAVSRLDTIIADVQEQKGTLGKLIYDPSLHDTAKQMLERGNVLISDVQAGKGTLGRLATDESLYTKWRASGENLEAATARLTSNQTTAGKFFSEPQFYDNMTGLAGDLRLLVGDFRKDPKKFLHVKLSIF